LEKYGIGRPSTYAPIISVIQERNYVYKNEQRRFQPTGIGELVNKILVEHFSKIVDVQFTAQMEEELDEIAQGKEKWQKVIGGFYQPFAENLEKKYQEVERQKPIEEKTEEVCEKCGKPMVIRYGKFGKFLACLGFPKCQNTKSINNKLINDKGEEVKCPKCQTGLIIKRRTKKSHFFYGCSRYPECEFASWKKPDIKNK
jgi:DNA topoisomerase-1